MTKVHITTLGCPKNTVDSGHLSRALSSQGLLPVSDTDEADVLLVNTCGFIRDAKEESIEEILRLVKTKQGQGSGVRGKEKKLVVFGCLAKRYYDELMKEIPEIDALFGVGEDARIVEYCKSVQGKGHDDLTGPLPLTPHPLPPSYAYLKIADGCNKKCTFCVIPAIRGKFRSVSREDILKEAQSYVKQGVRELILVAQDITNYGAGSKDYNLTSLLKDLVSIKGDFFIRLLYLYPAEITDGLLKLIASEEKILNYLDIPLQHSEDRILRSMGRRGSKKEYIKLIRTIRKTIPGVALRTTFIVGFPEETEDDFNGLVDFIEEIKFDRLGVFKYSREEGTPADKLRGHVPEKVKDRRLDEIMTRQAAISLEKNLELVGRRYPAVVDEIEEDVAIARLYSHAPEIDGVVILEDFKAATSDIKKGIKAGDVVQVEILEALDYDVKGKIISHK
jgi:ribosomal protein S12 methylthiotransferase